MHYRRHDFNKEIADGTTFVSIDKIQGSFDRYLSNCFDPPNRLDEDAEESQAERDEQIIRPRVKKTRSKSRDELVQQVTRSDGTIWIPDVSNASRTELQGTVRGFLTAHYSKYGNGDLHQCSFSRRKGMPVSECISPIQKACHAPSRTFLSPAPSCRIYLP